MEQQTIPLIQSQGLGLLVWSPLAGGFLSGKFTREGGPEGTSRATFYFPPIHKEQGFDIVDVIWPIAEAHHASVSQVALAALLHKEAVTSVIICVKDQGRLYPTHSNKRLLLSW